MTRIKEKISNKGMIVYLTKIIGRQGMANSLENGIYILGVKGLDSVLSSP